MCGVLNTSNKVVLIYELVLSSGSQCFHGAEELNSTELEHYIRHLETFTCTDIHIHGIC